MSPFPGWKVIPDGWAEHHRPTAESTMVTPARFIRVNGPAPYPLPDNWQGSELLWETKVRVQSLNNAPKQADAAEQTVTIRRYLVTAPVGGPAVRLGKLADQIHVLGRRLRIVDIAPGSLLWEADYTCEENLTQGQPIPLVEEVPDAVGEQPDQGSDR